MEANGHIHSINSISPFGFLLLPKPDTSASFRENREYRCWFIVGRTLSIFKLPNRSDSSFRGTGEKMWRGRVPKSYRAVGYFSKVELTDENPELKIPNSTTAANYSFLGWIQQRTAAIKIAWHFTRTGWKTSERIDGVKFRRHRFAFQIEGKNWKYFFGCLFLLEPHRRIFSIILSIE